MSANLPFLIENAALLRFTRRKTSILEALRGPLNGLKFRPEPEIFRSGCQWFLRAAAARGPAAMASVFLFKDLLTKSQNTNHYVIQSFYCFLHEVTGFIVYMSIFS